MSNFKKLAMASGLAVSILLTGAQTEARAKVPCQHEQWSINQIPMSNDLIIIYQTLEEFAEKMSVETSKTLDISKPCGLSKTDFVKLISNASYDYEGYLKRNAGFIWDMEQKYQINGLFYCGIAAYESGWGRVSYRNNYTGMGAGKKAYESEEEGIEDTIRYLRETCVDEYSVITPKKIGKKCYNFTDTWGSNVYSAMNMIVRTSLKKLSD